MLSTSQLILLNLIKNENYHKTVIPFLKQDYFDSSEKVFFGHIEKYSQTYQSVPTFESLFIEISNDKNVTENQAVELDELFTTLKSDHELNNEEWLLKTTEDFCKDKALHNAILESISIMEGNNKKYDKGYIPELLKEALAIEFDSSLGHDFFEDAGDRWEYYHNTFERIPFNLEYMNKITKGGFVKKTLNLFLAVTHGGKTALMIHQAANNVKDGKFVVYFTMEMSEEEISKRVDANMMGLDIDDVINLPKDQYLNKINNLKMKSVGKKLIIKEYPTGAANVNHFRYFLNELKLKQGIIPDIIYVDYLNLCSSATMKGNNTANSYTLIKAVSEELRALAVEMNVCVVTASQFNRGSSTSSDPEMDGISESFGVNFTADFIIALVANDELKEKGVVMIKQLKNRYSDMNKIPRFFIGFDRAKMKFYDEKNPTRGIVNTNDIGKVIDKFDTSKPTFEGLNY